MGFGKCKMLCKFLSLSIVDAWYLNKNKGKQHNIARKDSIIDMCKHTRNLILTFDRQVLQISRLFCRRTQKRKISKEIMLPFRAKGARLERPLNSL